MTEAAWLLSGPEPWGDFRHYAVNVFAATTGMNLNGLIRQYTHKRTSMAAVTQAYCDAIANRLNSCPQFVRPSKNETSG